MAADSLIKYASENNIKLKVERQAAQWTINELNQDDIKQTDYVIIATEDQ
ncbi:MAG: hypothetical protein NC236_01135 [Mycoplasma sp.]|nr:hypothetical protein [Mycoplasma sp.]